jgi:hypothetical protein
MVLRKAWRGSGRLGWPTRRVRISGGLWRQRQSAREGESGQNEVGEGEWVRVGLKKELGRVCRRRGRSSQRVRGRGSATVAGKIELTRLAHSAERERARVE